jgi:hypothetical protein
MTCCRREKAGAGGGLEVIVAVAVDLQLSHRPFASAVQQRSVQGEAAELAEGINELVGGVCGVRVPEPLVEREALCCPRAARLSLLLAALHRTHGGRRRPSRAQSQNLVRRRHRP